MKYELSQSARLKHDEASDNYYLFCIKSGKHVRLNLTSYSILMLLEEGKNSDEIAASLCEDYDVDWGNSEKDIRKFLQFLSENGFING
ncbi:MAG: PqqD family protein [Deltaproteobacteria bacterium]|nr:PqqD family protein [Deltaproteobacteria bacterium]